MSSDFFDASNKPANGAVNGASHDDTPALPGAKTIKKPKPPKKAKDPDPRCIETFHRIAAALAHTEPSLGVKPSPFDMPRPSFKLAILKDERGILWPISIEMEGAEKGKVTHLSESMLKRAVTDFLPHKDLVMLLDHEFDGSGAKIASHSSRNVSDIVHAWWAYAEHVTQDQILPLKEWDKPGQTETSLAWVVLPFRLEDERGKPTPWFDEIVSRIEGGDLPKKALMAFVGSILHVDADRSQYLYLYGDGQDSKGRLLAALDYLLQNAMCTSSPNGIERPFWAFANVFNRRLVAFPDVQDPSFLVRDTFKQLTGDDSITLEKKGEDAFKARLFCKFIMGANALPTFTGTKAERRRAIIVKLKTYQGRHLSDRELRKVYETEGPAFLAKCDQVYRELCPNHRTIPADDMLDPIIEENEAGYIDIFQQYFIVNEDMGISLQDIALLFKHLGMKDPSLKQRREFLAVIERHLTKIGAGDLDGSPIKFVPTKKKGYSSQGQDIKTSDTPNAISAYWGLGIKYIPRVPIGMRVHVPGHIKGDIERVREANKLIKDLRGGVGYMDDKSQY